MKRLKIILAIFFLIPTIIFGLNSLNILKNEVLYPIFYQLSITFVLILAIFYFLKIERRWKGWLGWLFILLSLIFLFIGDTIWNYYAIFFLKEAPFPGFSDIFYVTFYLFASLALIYFILLFKLTLSPTEKFLISLISILIFLLLFHQVVLSTIYSKEMSSLEKFLNSFYILGDFLLIILSLILLIQLWGGKRAKNYSIFIFGLALMTIADIIFVYIFKEYGIANIIDIFYLASFITLSYSIINESMFHISS